MYLEYPDQIISKIFIPYYGDICRQNSYQSDGQTWDSAVSSVNRRELGRSNVFAWCPGRLLWRNRFSKYFPAVSFPNNLCLIQFVAHFSFPEGKLSTDGSLRLMCVISWFGLRLFFLLNCRWMILSIHGRKYFFHMMWFFSHMAWGRRMHVLCRRLI